MVVDPPGADTDTGAGSAPPRPRRHAVGDSARARAERLADKGKETTERLHSRVRSPLHDEWVASVLGVALGVSFTVCFLTGLVDHFAQSGGWFHLPARPVNLYRVNEGIHVVTGVATIPLLLSKLWAVYPQLLAWPPVRSLAHGLERLSLIFLVGGSLFELVTGVINIDYWYSPMGFSFTIGHYWVAWMVVGALVIHIGAKGVAAAHAIARGPHAVADPDDAAADSAQPAATSPEPAATGPEPPGPPVDVHDGGLTRRGFVGVAFAAAGALVLVVAGETVAPLRRLALLAPRNPVVGPQQLPVNQTAVEAGVTRTAIHPDYQLRVTGNCTRPRAFTLDELRRLPQRDAGLPISCVEGWSAAAQWRGVSLRHLLDVVGAPVGASARVESLESSNRLYSSSVVDAGHASDPDTLLALELNGEVLDLDHGYPVRLIAPDRPGVLQTKWLSRIVVL